jgi:hypothetical protein
MAVEIKQQYSSTNTQSYNRGSVTQWLGKTPDGQASSLVFTKDCNVNISADLT